VLYFDTLLQVFILRGLRGLCSYYLIIGAPSIDQV